jgi:hypothetical protein
MIVLFVCVGDWLLFVLGGSLEIMRRKRISDRVMYQLAVLDLDLASFDGNLPYRYVCTAWKDLEHMVGWCPFFGQL